MSPKLLRFIVLAVVSYLAWFFLYDLWLKPNGMLDRWLTDQIASATSGGLNLLGYESSYKSSAFRSSVYINGKYLLGIAHVCNGLVLYALFTGFIVCFPGNIRQKLWFIPAGTVSIYLINILRAITLSLIKLHAPQSLDFNHRYTFTLVMYSFIFVLWMIWVNRFSGITRSEKKETATV
jgi:exosortase family protein XrtF